MKNKRNRLIRGKYVWDSAIRPYDADEQLTKRTIQYKVQYWRQKQAYASPRGEMQPRGYAFA